MTVKIRIDAPDLFGNEAADMEVDELFRSTLIDRQELTTFSDPQRTILILSAYKGEGKSALLRALKDRLASQATEVIVATTGPSVAPAVTGQDVDVWRRGWKRSLFSVIAGQVGAKLGFDWNDDSMALVEEAEKLGYRQKSLFWAILDRVKPTLNLGNEAATLNFGGERSGPANVEGALRRVDPDALRGIWLLVDDIDRNFRNIKQDRAKIAGFFDAIREMCIAVPQLRVRASIRPNVYSSVKLHFESLAVISQYILPIQWTEDEIRTLLAQRIEAYLQRTEQMGATLLPKLRNEREGALLGYVFENPVQWNKSRRSVHIPLYTLSAHRPRWVIELCKLAARRASERHRSQITLFDITGEMGQFGASRRDDLIAEFRPQCPDISDMIDAFDGQAEEYSTDELLSLIDRRILAKITPRIAGVAGVVRASHVASFLFEIGLFFGRRELESGGYQHFSFSQKTSLFLSKTNPDDGLRWEIHPVFRQYLRMRDAYGVELQRSTTGEHG